MINLLILVVLQTGYPYEYTLMKRAVIEGNRVTILALSVYENSLILKCFSLFSPFNFYVLTFLVSRLNLNKISSFILVNVCRMIK